MYDTKTLRELIFKGANKFNKNKQGKKPIDLAANIQDDSLRSDVFRVLGPQPVYLPCFHVK